MATYDFQCKNDQCSSNGALFEVRLPMDERDTSRILCSDCGSEARRQVVPSKAPACVMTVPLNNGGHTKERLLP